MKKFKANDIYIHNPLDYFPKIDKSATTNDIDTERAIFAFSYRKPFRRPHSISFGARGLVSLDLLQNRNWSGKSGDLYTTVQIIKGNRLPNSWRNTFQNIYSSTELMDRAIVLDLENELLETRNVESFFQIPDTLKTMARLVISDTLEKYSNTQGRIFDIIDTLDEIGTGIPKIYRS